ncbi:MAG TPA: isoprenylcysteine carboxylmethyltransferase family protein [Stellaceae bacterium]|jgi:methyltransferase|nr:isoprenylcysteine carboxylmethyltransferase family protein [Stellaceae bacterium]
MSALGIVLVLVALQRLGELAYAARNTRALLARGAVEYGRGHYPLIVALHAAWLATVLIFVPWRTPPDWFWLGLFFLLQVARLWVVVSLGPHWTTRIIALPDTPLVRRGPYRWLKHPNYCVVAAEIAVLPLAFGAWPIALSFTLLNAAMLAWRIHVEAEALGYRRIPSSVTMLSKR